MPASLTAGPNSMSLAILTCPLLVAAPSPLGGSLEVQAYATLAKVLSSCCLEYGMPAGPEMRIGEVIEKFQKIR